MAITIERPGVQVLTEFQSVSPTIFVPTLPACVLGPCNQIIEAVQDDGSLNPDARISLPARLAFSWVSTPFEYVGIGTDALILAVNNGAPVTITFPTGPNLTTAQVADAINEAEVPGLLALVEVSGSQRRVVVYTTATGENASIEVITGTHVDVRTAFGITIGYRNTGASGYTNYVALDLQVADYPDPRSNIDEVVIDYDTVRVFINDGAGNIREALRTESFLDGDDTAVTVQDDGDGDNLSPYLNFAGAVFADQAAQLVGTVDWTTLTYPGDFGVFTLEIIINGVTVVVTFANPANAAAAAAAIDTALGVNGSCALNGSNRPVITSAVVGVGSSVEIGSAGTINEATIGLPVASYAGGKPSRARAQGDADLTAVTHASEIHGRVLRMSIDGDQFQQLVFPATTASAADIVAAINGLWAGVASLNDANELVLTSLAPFGGRESVIRLDKSASDATLLTALGLTGAGEPFETVSAVFGLAFSPQVGDEVWVNGLRIGEVTEVPVTPTNRLRLSAEQLLTYTGGSWYIIAKDLDNQAATALRPSSDLRVDGNTGTVVVKHELFRESDGDPVLAGPLSTYLAYTGLRQDVSPATEDFNLLRFGTTTALEEQLSPVDTQNPLALGLYFAILNAPGTEVTGLGVDETSDTETEGTLDAYVRALEYLESKDVYAIAPLTHSNTVGQVAQVHVDALSLPENGLERIVILNPRRPTRKSDTLVASAPTANVAGPPTNVVNTGIANLQALLAAAGLPGPTFTEDDAVFLEFESDTNKYLVEAVSGGVVTINDGPLSSDNEVFYDGGGSPVFTAAIVDRPVTVKILGASIGSNRTDEATAYADIARGYLDRRVIATAPDQAKASIDGLETLIRGYYLSAALAGKMSSIGPSQPLTEESLAGFTGVVGSQDRYSELQLKILSGGGLWVFFQDADGQPVRTRHQLTTDMSTIEKRESSITRALDFAAKFFRVGLRNFIGRFNNTTNIQDAISIVLDGLGAFLIRQGVFESIEVNAVRQNASSPDELEIDITVGVFYPLNKIRITLVV